MAKKAKKMQYKGDYILLYLVISLILFGVVMVFSASYYTAMNVDNDAYAYLKKGVVYAILSIGAMMVVASVDYRIYSKYATLGLVVSVILLVLVWAPVIGVNLNGAHRWIGIPGVFTIMPGELAKIFGTIFIAAYLSKDPRRILSFKQGILPCLGVIVLYFGLILKQPNLSTAVTVVMIIVSIMFAAGLQIRYIIGGAIGGMGVLAVAILADPDGYRMARITSFLDPFSDPQGAGYQVIQSLYALGSGGLFGVGLGKSIQKTLYLPEPQNDFILAIIGEELGFIGIALVVVAYLILVWRGIHIAINAPDLFGSLVATGITSMIGVQVILNIAVVTSSMPPTGVSLPMISWGGNSLVMMGAAMGILLNISKHIPNTK